MTGWLVDTANNIEIEFPALKTFTTISSTNLSRFSRVSDGMPGVSSGEGQPFEIMCLVDFTDLSLFDTVWRKLNYFEKTQKLVLLILPSENKAIEGYVEQVSFPISSDRANIASVTFKFLGGGFVMGYMKGAADLTTTGTVVTDADGNADQALRLDAQNETGYFDIVQSAWTLPGLVMSGAAYQTYRLYARAKDSTHVASDLKLWINNIAHTERSSTTVNPLTSGYKWYSCDYTLVSGDDGDTFRLGVSKIAGDANNIYVDMVLFVQRYV